MKTLIIYFSQTSNTRKIAECIHDGIIDAKSECIMKALNDVEPTSLSDYELIGIGSPVFWYKEPFNVQDFIEALPEQEGRHWFVFCTHGNIIGNFFPSVTKKLNKRGATVIGFHNTYANITVPFYPRPSYTSGHPDSYDFEQARAFGREIVERSLKITHNGDDFIPKPEPVSSQEWIEESKVLTKEAIKNFMPKFSINTDTCIQCHECEENCPVQGIDIEAEPPRIQDPCIYCWRCVTICPTLSVEADWEPLVAMAPANYARYKKELDKVTARGEFRWLIDPETIVFDDPLYKQRQREIKDKE
jgi:flavodoxin/NAD-dependent dihydropyrimidine dehydrogenase PreA subunit